MTLLQAANMEVVSGDAGILGFSNTTSILLLVAIAVVGYIVEWRLRSVFSRYSDVALDSGKTGGEIALEMLHAHGIYNVQVVRVRGLLTDHFNPTTLTVALSDATFNSSSVTAAAVACHECGHALQYMTGYSPLTLRTRLVPIISFSSRIASWIIIAGIALLASTGNAALCWLGIFLVSMSALFAVVTLPVEYNASARALAWLRTSNIIAEDKMTGARESLRWAARTYLVAALGAIATLIYYITLINSRRR